MDSIRDQIKRIYEIVLEIDYTTPAKLPDEVYEVLVEPREAYYFEIKLPNIRMYRYEVEIPETGNRITVGNIQPISDIDKILYNLLTVIAGRTEIEGAIVEIRYDRKTNTASVIKYGINKISGIITRA